MLYKETLGVLELIFCIQLKENVIICAINIVRSKVVRIYELSTLTKVLIEVVIPLVEVFPFLAKRWSRIT